MMPRIIFIAFKLLLCLSVTSVAQAQPAAPSAPSSASGSYTVTYALNSNPLVTVILQELAPGGTWMTISDANSNGSVTLSRTPGTYKYRILEVTRVGPPQYFAIAFSSEITVVVYNGPAPTFDEIEDQLGYTFTLRSGHIDNDGNLDLFVQRTSGDPDNGVLAEAILKGQPDGTYTRFLPTQSQLAQAANWVPIQAEYEIGDFNLDEVADLTIAGLPNNAVQHMLISSGEFFDRNAQAVFPLTAEREMFYRDMAAWLTDPAHFANAILPTVPGYNIRIVFQIEYCYFYGSFPGCYAYDFEIFNEDFTLADLGLDGHLGKHSKTSPGGVSGTSAGAYISSDVHNAVAPTLSQYGIADLRGTVADKQTAVDKHQAAMSKITGPQTLVCFYFCGYAIDIGYSDFVIYSWYDVWTPITMGGGFDAANYSKHAYDITQIFADVVTNGESAVTDAEWQQVAGILTQVAVPGTIPDTWPQDDSQTRDKKKLGLWGRLWLGVWAIIGADVLNDVLRDYRWLYHFTSEGGRIGIAASGVIKNLANPGGPVFLTHMAYPTGEMAEELLALCGAPVVGYYAVRLNVLAASIILPVQSKTCEPDTAQAGTYRQGGGWEQTAPSPVNALPLRWFDVPRTF